MMADRIRFAIVARAAIGLGFTIALATSAASGASFPGTLSASTSDGVVFAVDCFDSGSGAPASLTVEIADLVPVAPPTVSAQIRKGNAATNTTDAVDGDLVASPAVFLDGGAGRYDVFVDKTAAGGESFELTAQCWTGTAGTGALAGTSISMAAGGGAPAGSFAGLAVLVAALAFTAHRMLIARAAG